MPVIGPFNFSKGYSTGTCFTDNVPSFTSTMQNCRFKDGEIRLRWGFRNIGTADSNAHIQGLTVWNDITTGKLAVVATSDSPKLLTADITNFNPSSTNATFVDRTGALAAASINSLTTFDSLNNILVGSANSASSGAVFKLTAYNVNGAALGGSPPSCSIAKQCNNFMFLSRNLSSTTTQSKVYWSNVNDPETWTAANALDFNKNDGEPIMALGSIGTDLYIFKKTSIGRLSTVTITTSGAVTLGPLSTVIRGIGCCGPRALDNLSNGNIVFWGYDGHFYEFDGSTVVDLSVQPYPGHNVYDQSRYSAGGGSSGTSIPVDLGLCDMSNDVNATVKVVRGLGEVYITATSAYSHTSGNIGPYTMVYDFVQGIWQGNTFQSQGTGSDAGGFSYATVPMDGTAVNILESTDALIFGDVIGRVIVCGDFTHPYPNNAGSAVASYFELSQTVSLMANGEPFIPRSICFETNLTNTAGASQPSLLDFIVYANFDQCPASTAVYTATAGVQLPVRIVAPLTFKQDSVGTNVFPGYLTVRFSGRGQGSISSLGVTEVLRLGKFWLSDEIIR